MNLSSGRDGNLVSHSSIIMVTKVSDSVTARVSGGDNDEVVRGCSLVPRDLSVLTLGKGRGDDGKSEGALNDSGSKERNSKECGEHPVIKTENRGVIKGGGGGGEESTRYR